MNDGRSESGVESSSAGSTKGWIDRFNARAANLVRFISNLKTLVLTAIVIVAISLAVIEGSGRQMLQGWISEATGTKHVPLYEPVTAHFDQSFLATQGILEADGIVAPAEEFSVWRGDDGIYHYKWRRNDEERRFAVNRDFDGVWIVNEER